MRIGIDLDIIGFNTQEEFLYCSSYTEIKLSTLISHIYNLDPLIDSKLFIEIFKTF